MFLLARLFLCSVFALLAAPFARANNGPEPAKKALPVAQAVRLQDARLEIDGALSEAA